MFGDVATYGPEGVRFCTRCRPIDLGFPQPMIKNDPLRQSLRSGRLALGGWCSMPSSISAEVMGSAGFTYVCVDLQHGLIGDGDLVPMLQAVSVGESSALVRVPSNEAGIIGKALDAGAVGVIVPMVNTADQCRAAVNAGKYAPQGSRSFGPIRAGMIEGSDYFDEANAGTVIIPMIETAEAIENIDAILSVEGVDTIYVGPVDLAISIGCRPGSSDPEFLQALATIVEACERHDVVPGIHASADLCVDRVGRGFKMITVSADLVGLRARVAADFATASSRASDTPDSPS